MSGMSPTELRLFVEKISATAIANQAILKCQLRNIPVTVDNVILCVGDFFDPSDASTADLSEKILVAILETVEQVRH